MISLVQTSSLKEEINTRRVVFLGSVSLESLGNSCMESL